MKPTLYAVMYGVLMMFLTCLQYYVRIINPKIRANSKPSYTTQEAEEKIVTDIFGSKAERFTVEQIKNIQNSSNPFSNEELNKILDDELELGEQMNTDLVDYFLEKG